MLMVVLGAVAWATGGVPYDGGFAVPEGVSIPADAWVPLHAVDAEVDVVAGPSGPGPLVVEPITGFGRASLSLAAPPTGGWVAGAHVLQAWPSGDASVDPSGQREITVQMVEALAADVETLTVGPVTATPWSEPTDYAWGCCFPVRTVSLEVVFDGGPLAWAEAVGDYDLGEPSQITESPRNQVLDVAVGEGTHRLVFEQWYASETGVQPPCFSVIAWSAARGEGPSEVLCVDDGPQDPDAAEAGCGCQGLAGGAWLAWLAGAAVFSRRRYPKELDAA